MCLTFSIRLGTYVAGSWRVNVNISRRDTLYPWTGLPINSVLAGTHMCCLLRDKRRRADLFLSCTGRLRPSSCVSGKPLVFHQRYAFQVLQIPSQCLNPGNYRIFYLIQSSIITLAYSDEPYMQNYGKIMETPIPRTRT